MPKFTELQDLPITIVILVGVLKRAPCSPKQPLGGVNTGILRSGEGPGGGKSQSLQAAAAAVRVRNQHISRSLMPAEEISC